MRVISQVSQLVKKVVETATILLHIPLGKLTSGHWSMCSFRCVFFCKNCVKCYCCVKRSSAFFQPLFIFCWLFCIFDSRRSRPHVHGGVFARPLGVSFFVFHALPVWKMQNSTRVHSKHIQRRKNRRELVQAEKKERFYCWYSAPNSFLDHSIETI